MRNQGKAWKGQMSFALKKFQEHSPQFVYTILLHVDSSSIRTQFALSLAASFYFILPIVPYESVFIKTDIEKFLYDG